LALPRDAFEIPPDERAEMRPPALVALVLVNRAVVSGAGAVLIGAVDFSSTLNRRTE
jgi:hypothetical protein